MITTSLLISIGIFIIAVIYLIILNNRNLKLFRKNIDEKDKYFEKIISEKEENFNEQFSEIENLSTEYINKLKNAYEQRLSEAENIIKKYEEYITGLDINIKMADAKLEQIDERGMFKADDEIGWFFDTVKQIQKNLNQFKIELNKELEYNNN